LAEAKLREWSEAVSANTSNTIVDIDLTLPPVPNKIRERRRF